MASRRERNLKEAGSVRSVGRHPLGVAAACAALVLGLAASARCEFGPQGSEFRVVGETPGDQVAADVAIGRLGGLLVWHDNATDEDGLGISALRLNADLSRWPKGAFRVNRIGTGHQENARVTLLHGGGACVVWQGGSDLRQDIYARVLRPDFTFANGDDLMVNANEGGSRQDPALAPLTDGGAIVVWGSTGQDGSLQGVYGQRVSAAGERVGSEFRVNDFAAFNQRTPAVAALADGRFVITWVSEQQRFENSVDIYARLYSANAEPVSGELLVNTGTNVCANPSVAASTDGGFTVAWGEKFPREVVDLAVVSTNSWDVMVRAFTGAGQARGAAGKVNSFTYGEQFAPRIASLATEHLVIWTSLGQDGSREGVFAQRLGFGGERVGDEFRVNTTTASMQIRPAVASDEDRRALVVWSSFVGGLGSFDLVGQQYETARALRAPPPPVVSALEDHMLMVSWPQQSGNEIVRYRLYVDQATEPALVSGNYWVVSDLGAGTTHTFQIAYELADGRVSPLSDPATGRTWGRDGNRDGLPDDWQQQHWGTNNSAWPGRDADVDGDGSTNLHEFLAGTDPLDAGSALRTSMLETGGGLRLSWNSVPGSIYQPQVSTDLAQWDPAGSPRYAAGGSDSIPIAGGPQAAYYRVIRLR
jgi:hypothetical protein